MSDAPDTPTVEPWTEPVFGETYTDELYGLVGLCTGVTYHLTGCTTVSLGITSEDDPKEYDVTVVRLKGYEGDPKAHPDHVAALLGTKARDRYLDMDGVIISYYVSSYNEDKVCLQWVDRNGHVEGRWVDISRLETTAPPPASTKTGAGPAAPGTVRLGR